jgi:hypothetical protein
MVKKTTKPQTFINITDTNSTKFYTIKGVLSDGLRYATASNWKSIGKMPKENAISSEIKNSFGQSFTVYAENQLTDYDAEAEAKAKEQHKALKAEYNGQATDLHKAFKSHKIDVATYAKAYDSLIKEAEAKGINLA